MCVEGSVHVVITNRKDPTLSRPRREDGEPIKQIILPHTQLRGGGGAGVQEGTEASSPQACSVLEAPVTLLCSRCPYTNTGHGTEVTHTHLHTSNESKITKYARQLYVTPVPRGRAGLVHMR